VPSGCSPLDLRDAKVFANLSDSLGVRNGVAVSEVRARWVEFKELSHALAGAENETSRLQMVVDSAPSLIPGCDHAGVTLNAKGGVVTLVSSDEVVRRANELQYDLGEGPCLNMRRDQDTLVSNDLTHEDRWARWAKHVNADLGVYSMMSLLVYTDRESYGALSLYASAAHGFDADDVAIGQGLAGHLAVIMAAGREIGQLGTAMHSRTIIGQAQGILMSRLDIDADQAFDYLRRVSSHSNRKLVDVAQEIARTRQLPDQR
jgi:ANTAR domain/GAF domain